MDNPCYRCGGKGHWLYTYHMPKHLVDLYQESLKNKEKQTETNFSHKGDVDHGHIDDTWIFLTLDLS